MSATYDVVVPTLGRASLATLLTSLAASSGPKPERIVVVDDRPDAAAALPVPRDLGVLGDRIDVVRGSVRGPAAARNRGSRAATAPWLVFLDDDVVVEDDWCARLADDLRDAAPTCAGVAGRVRVPLPADRRPTDWERNVAALESAAWITADLAYRRDVFRSVGGFDERFPRAFREDADLALRIEAAGYGLAVGTRRVRHPVRSADAWVSVRLQAGNADDALMTRKYGRAWSRAVPHERREFRRHVVRVGAALVTVAAFCAWATTTATFAWRRIAPGPRDRGEVATLLATSVAIPFAAVYHRLRGAWTLARGGAARRTLPAAVLFDRDGTLVRDDPSLRAPDAVGVLPGAAEALERLRREGIAIGVVSNQHRVGEGDMTAAELALVNARIDRELGAMDVWAICTHARDAACSCRKPQPGLILDAARRLQTVPDACVVVGDIGSDIDAARRAGARAILVPTAVTLPDEVARAPLVARSLADAVDLILRGAA